MEPLRIGPFKEHLNKHWIGQNAKSVAEALQ